MKKAVFIENPAEVRHIYPHPWKSGLDFNTAKETILPGAGLVTFRRDFALPEGTARVLLRATALGVFHLFLNGKKVGDEEMKPGWTDYHSRVFEFEYDVTALCGAQNTLIVPVAPGWWSGRISVGEYGFRHVAFAGELEFLDAAGNTLELIASDETWQRAIGGQVRFSDIYDGEYIDATVPDIAAAPAAYHWRGAARAAEPLPAIVPQVGEPVRYRPALSQVPVFATAYRETRDNGTDFGEIVPLFEKQGKGCERTELHRGETLILDLGQEIVGRPRLTVLAPRGARVEIFCAEMRNDSGSRARGNDGAKGTLYLENYRSARSRTVYIAAGDKEETVTAGYSFFGFRYLAVRADADVSVLAAVGDFLSTDMPETGFVETDNEEVNRLFRNILWGQRCNYLSVPTDCPQRDERLGWTGDTQIFCGAATYNADADGFLRKWLGDARDSQRYSPGYSDVIPAIGALSANKQDGNAAWGDAPVIVPYMLWLKYGDTETIREHFDSMESYMAFLATLTPAGPRERFGDWLCYEDTPKPYISLCLYACDAGLMEKYANILGKPDRAAHYHALLEELRARFAAEYLKNGELTVRSQTACLLAIRYGLVQGRELENVTDLLKEKILQNNSTLSTGFVGTGILNQTLSQVGLDVLAYSLLLQTRDPSWLYSVRQGATTVWERWNSYTLEKGFGNVSMNSFNHYAYGAVAEWMYESMAGIKADPAHPGFTHFILAPKPDFRSGEEIPAGQERIRHVKAYFAARTGRIESEWGYENGRFTYRFTIPEGTSARVEFPLIDPQPLTLNGKPALQFTRIGGVAVAELPAGRYVLQ